MIGIKEILDNLGEQIHMETTTEQSRRGIKLPFTFFLKNTKGQK